MRRSGPSAGSIFQKAFALRDRTTDREKLYIAAHYYSDVVGYLPRGIDAYELWESLYPRDVIPVENLGNIFDALGEPEKALALEQKAIRMRPDGSMRYALLAWAELEAGRYPALNRLCTDPKYTHAEQVLLHVSCYLAAFAQHDTSAMQPQLAWGQGKPQQSVLLEFAAWAEMSTGRLADARHTFAEARDSAARNNMIDFAAGLDTDEAWLDANLGFTAQARARATEALKSASDLPDMQASAALALARSGDTSGADAAMARVSAASPRNTVLISGVLSAARAAEAMDRHDPAAAIRLLEQSRPMDDVASLSLAPGYYRGLAYLDDHQYEKAEREFQSVLDHRVLMPESLYVQLSSLQLGHALQLEDHPSEALRQYQQLDQAWTYADRDFPALRQLKGYEKQLERHAFQPAE